MTTKKKAQRNDAAKKKTLKKRTGRLFPESTTPESLPVPPGLKPNTRRAYEIAIGRFNEENAGRKTTAERIAEHLDFLRERNLSPSTVQLARAALRMACLSKLRSPEDRARLDVALSARKTPRPAVGSPKTVLSFEQVESLCGETRPNVALMIRALYSTGARISELLEAMTDDCLENGSVVEIRTENKTGDPGPIYMPADLFHEIKRHFGSGTGTRLFRNKNPRSKNGGFSYDYFYLEIRKAGEKSGLETGTHVFRRSAATTLIDGGVSVGRVQRFLRHKNAATTLNAYYHPEINPERDFFEKLGTRAPAGST